MSLCSRIVNFIPRTSTRVLANEQYEYVSQHRVQTATIYFVDEIVCIGFVVDYGFIFSILIININIRRVEVPRMNRPCLARFCIRFRSHLLGQCTRKYPSSTTSFATKLVIPVGHAIAYKLSSHTKRAIPRLLPTAIPFTYHYCKYFG